MSTIPPSSEAIFHNVQLRQEFFTLGWSAVKRRHALPWPIKGPAPKGSLAAANNLFYKDMYVSIVSQNIFAQLGKSEVTVELEAEPGGPILLVNDTELTRYVFTTTPLCFFKISLKDKRQDCTGQTALCIKIQGIPIFLANFRKGDHKSPTKSSGVDYYNCYQKVEEWESKKAFSLQTNYSPKLPRPLHTPREIDDSLYEVENIFKRIS